MKETSTKLRFACRRYGRRRRRSRSSDKGKPSQPPGKAKNASAAQYQYGKTKVTLCHKGKTITVGAPAVKAHVRHGDHVGSC